MIKKFMSKEISLNFVQQELPSHRVNRGQLHSEGTSETESESTFHEDIEEKRILCFNSDTLSTEQRKEFSSGSELFVETTSIYSKESTISATHTPTLSTEHGFPSVGDRSASVASSTEFGPCSQKAFNGASILLAAQQQLDLNRQKREVEINRELRSEDQLKKEKRLQLEESLRAEAQANAEEQERLLELQRRQQLEQHRINEERQRKFEEERRQLEIIDQERRLEEDRQRREYLKRKEIERNKKQLQEAETRKQKAIEDQTRRREEEKARVERQCEFSASATIEPINMPSASTNGAQHHRADTRGASNNQQLYLAKRQQQHQRSGTMSSNGETPMKFRSTRNKNHGHSSIDHMNNPDTPTPTLFFERIVNEEVAEIKSYTEIIQNQNREIIELKNKNNDMELRLQHQTNDRIELESTIEDQEVHWHKKCEELEQTVESCMKALEAEKTNNKKLWDLVYAKEKEIQRLYHRRYDGSSSSQPGNRRGPHQRTSPGDRGLATQRGPAEHRAVTLNRHRSPHDYLEASGSTQNIQERTSLKLLEGFFGFN